ncbi:Integrase catalytic core protein [Phytophthora palmivora]|uniref:Integrase catalytic core protein n=1 Tax=Phytophthora palmivora TaxID=4796 RepID=A0A2P4YT34_9STRA|nr:Integrase catalytic core protein [Phytophthora palmivora]
MRNWREGEVKIPRTFRQAMRSKQAHEWHEAMLKNGSVTVKRSGQHFIITRWIFDVNVDEMGYVIRFRARLVARGFRQIAGVDFDDTFSPVARMSSFRLLLALAILKDFLVKHDYTRSTRPNGLRQSGKEWNDELDAWFKANGFIQCRSELCLYFYSENDTIAFVLVYVDGLICAPNSEDFKCGIFDKLGKDYGIKDLGLLHKYLGIRKSQSINNIMLKRYWHDLDSNSSAIPMETTLRLEACKQKNDGECKHDQDQIGYHEVVGCLMYLVTSTRPDLMYAVGQLSRYVNHPTEKHVDSAKRVLRYVLGTTGKGITYRKSNTCDIGIRLDGYSDSDWGNDKDTRKRGGAISWASRRQTIVAQSTAEAEYVAACEAVMEGRALMNILNELLPEVKRKLTLGVDNHSSYVIAPSPTFSRRTRHIELKWHFVREQFEKKHLYTWKVRSEDNPADLFTKPLAKV